MHVYDTKFLQNTFVMSCHPLSRFVMVGCPYAICREQHIYIYISLFHQRDSHIRPTPDISVHTM